MKIIVYVAFDSIFSIYVDRRYKIKKDVDIVCNLFAYVSASFYNLY